MTKDELKPGAEMDLAVAKAVGISCQDIFGRCIRTRINGVTPESFYPSRDWNDAMEALEKAFPNGWHLGYTPGAPARLRYYCKVSSPPHVEYETARPHLAPTILLAICEAILATEDEQ